METLCRSCGFNNPPGMRFCGNCGARLNAPTPEAASSPVLPEQLGVMIGSDLLARFREAGLEAAGQRRNVTVLFADLSEYTSLASQIDNEDLYEIIQQYIGMLVNAVYKYDGMVDKIVGDGLMALFGAPIAHENNAERALHAALDMQSGLAEINQDLQKRSGFALQMHIGLHSGTVVVGSVGSNMLMDYTAIGDTVNLAQRLEEAAGGGMILVSQAVYRQTQRLFDFDAPITYQLKGFPEALPGYRLIGKKAKPGSVRGLEGLRAPMIGREAELRQLLAAVERLKSERQGTFALIRGEAGLGKSRLVAELKASMDRQAVQVYQGQSLTYRRSVAYWIFQDALRDLLGLTPDMSTSQLRTQLSKCARSLLGRRASEMLPYLEQLFSLRPSDPQTAERLELLDANQLRQQIFIAVRELLAAQAGQQPLLLVLDDLHWADDASLDLLLFLLDTVRDQPLMICGISRPFEAGLLAQLEERAERRFSDHYLDISLKSLPPNQSEQLFFELLSIPELPLSLREQIIQRAAGVPFYLEEILRMLIDNDLIYFEAGHWRLRPGADISNLGVPDNLQALILARFDHLPPEDRRVLQVASVIGREFNPAILARILDMDDTRLRLVLGRLLERAFLVINPGGKDDEYAFRHVLTSDAIYSTLLRRDRGELHGRVGEALEHFHADRLNEYVYLLARHYTWSPRMDRALHYLVLAGRKAGRDYLNAQAREYYQQALELLPRVAHDRFQALQIHMGLGDVLVFVGEYEQAREQYRSAQELIDVNESDQLKTYGILRRKISTTYERQGDFERALHNLEAAQRFVKDAPDQWPVEAAQNLSNMGWIYFRRGELEQAEEYLNQALVLVDGSNQYDVIASLYNRLGGVYFQKNELERASTFVRRSLVLREEIGDIGAVARSYNNLGLLGWKRGDWDSALESFQRSLELHTTIGDVEGTSELHGNLGLLLLERGQLEQASQHFRDALQIGQEIGHSFIIAITSWYFSYFYVMTEQWSTALDYASQAREILEEIGAHEPLVDVYTNTGQAWLGKGDLVLAREWADKALALLRQSGASVEAPLPTDNCGRALRLLGEVHSRQGDFEAAEQALKQSIQVFEGLGNQIEQGRSLLAFSRLAQARADWAAARLHLNEARLIFKQLGAQLDLKKLDGQD